MPKYIDFDALGVQSCNPDVFVNKGYAEGWNSLIKILHDAPAADVEPKRKWIPVTKRLPEVGEDVLIYAVGKADDFSSVIAIADRIIFRLFPSSEGVETWSSPWQYFMTDYEITHWMPLPEPPKGEDNADKIV